MGVIYLLLSVSAQLEMRTKLQDAELQVIRDEVLQDAERTTSALKLR